MPLSKSVGRGSSPRSPANSMKYTDEQIFKIGSTYSRHHLKRKLISEGLVPYECAECKIRNEWNGKPLTLQLDHTNGISHDNRLENLRFLCPNCHTQTDTYAGKNSRGMRPKIPKPNARALKLERDRQLWAKIKSDQTIAVGKWGWKGRAAEVVGITSQKFSKWLMRVDHQFAMTMD